MFKIKIAIDNINVLLPKFYKSLDSLRLKQSNPRQPVLQNHHYILGGAPWDRRGRGNP
jgi:hypothetical protein